MGFHTYWIETFISTVPEAATAGLVLFIFGAAALLYPDAEDKNAVFAAVGALLIAIGFAGPPILLEWHYWLIGGFAASLFILFVDGYRRP